MDQETRLLIETVAREASREAVNDTLITLGFDVSEPMKAQADMKAIRDFREAKEKVCSMTLRTAVGVVITSIFAIIVLGIKAYFGG